MVGCNAIAADDEAEARRLFTSAAAVVHEHSARPARAAAAADRRHRAYWTPAEKERASAMLRRSFVGSQETVRVGLRRSSRETGADELIIAAAIHDHAARLRSYELLAGIADAPTGERSTGPTAAVPGSEG